MTRSSAGLEGSSRLACPAGPDPDLKGRDPDLKGQCSGIYARHWLVEAPATTRTCLASEIGVAVAM